MGVRTERVKCSWILIVLAIAVSGCGDDPAQNNKSPEVNNVSAPTATEPNPAPIATASQVVESPGRDVYVHYCADCHDAGEGHPGTMQLAVRSGAEKSVLRSRTDLTPAFVKQIVRSGLEMMPPFRPTEIADAELDALANYVSGTSDKTARSMD